jgi:DNA invertase Pin-like site-specific DNA recombinase
MLSPRERGATLTIHVLAAVAEHEREAISERTEAALAATKGAREATRVA